MGVFKLDLMTLLVVFVVLSVIFTMTAGSKDGDQAAIGQVIPQAPVSVNKVGSAYSSGNEFRMAPVAIPKSRYSSKTWN